MESNWRGEWEKGGGESELLMESLEHKVKWANKTKASGLMNAFLLIKKVFHKWHSN